MIGVAREVAAATGVPFTLAADRCGRGRRAPRRASPRSRSRDPERCPDYLARILRDVGTRASPIRVQARLTAAGMRPISAAVDATNYAMLEIGQPLHPFDLTLLKGPGIVVRRASDGERMVTLDDVERTLTEDDLLICDVERPVGIAGVMGGAVAEISDATDQVLLEAASFERGGIQRTRRRIELSTEASMRFERGVDPEAASVGADRACRLMAEWCGAPRAPRDGRGRGGPAAEARRRCEPAGPSKLIGYDVSPADATEVFDRLMMRSEVAGDDVTVEVPGYRRGHRARGRPDRGGRARPGLRPRRFDAARRSASREGCRMPTRSATGCRTSLMRAGLREVRSFPFASDADLALTGDRDAIGVTNPLQADDRWLRTRLTPGLLAAIRRNAYRQVRERRPLRGRDGLPDGRRRARGAAQGGPRAHGSRRERAGPVVASTTSSMRRGWSRR